MYCTLQYTRIRVYTYGSTEELIHAGTYTWRDIHMTRRDIYTEGHTHKGTYTRRDIHTKGHTGVD